MYVTRFVPNTEYGQSSAMSYASYLEKERLLQASLDQTSSRQLSAYLDKQNDKVRVEGHEYFFNGTGNTYDSEDLTKALDANVKGLKKNEARYYAFSISPSAQEIKHLRRSLTDMRQALTEAGEEVPVDFEDTMLRNYLKEYAVQCMDDYARNFHHPEITGNRDLVWFGMVEKDRYWKSHDKEVRENSKIDKQITKLQEKGASEGRIAALEKKYIRECHVRADGSREIVRAMTPKSGDNWHIHVTVSRRDITNSINLSPNANGRGSDKHQLNGQHVRVGFDREAFKMKCEGIFDQQFAHRRLVTESYKQAKELRTSSPVAFHTQRLRDQAQRRAEDAEFAQLEVSGYHQYFKQILETERVDGLRLLQLKGYLARQIRQLDATVNVGRLMECDLEELQHRLEQMSAQVEFSTPRWADGVVANAGDKMIHVAGLQGYNPVSTVRKVLARGITMNKAQDRRREMFDKWYEIYSQGWHRENYLFESISERRAEALFLEQADYVLQNYGESIVILNGAEYSAALEERLVGDFLQRHWATWRADMVRSIAVETFGPDGRGVESIAVFEQMATERLLPMDAKASIGEAKKLCERPRKVEAIGNLFAKMPTDRALALTQSLERYVAEQGHQMTALQDILKDKMLSVAQKEDAILNLALTDKALQRALRDVRGGVMKILERRSPNLTSRELQGKVGPLMKELQQIKVQQQKIFKNVVEGFIEGQLPGYHIIVQSQSQLEQLLHELTPDADRYAERLLEAHQQITEQLSPHAEQHFEQHGRRLFGEEVILRNEHDLGVYVDKTFSPEKAKDYKKTLKNVYARIDEKRQAVIQQYVSKAIPREEIETVENQQRYINRFINKRFSPEVAKAKKEELQRRVAGACRRSAIPAPAYKVFDQRARHQVTARAMSKASVVKVMPISPQQLVIKSAFKLVNILTKGF